MTTSEKKNRRKATDETVVDGTGATTELSASPAADLSESAPVAPSADETAAAEREGDESSERAQDEILTLPVGK